MHRATIEDRELMIIRNNDDDDNDNDNDIRVGFGIPYSSLN